MATSKAHSHRSGKTGFFIGLLITLLLSFLMLVKFAPLEMMEEKLYDYRFRIRGTVPPPDKIVIAAIDEKSIERLGRWPWGRDKIANLVEKLARSGAEIIALDIIFSESEKNDLMLSRSIKEAGNVILAVVFDFNATQERLGTGTLVNSAFISATNPEMFSKYSPITSKSILMPVSELSNEAMALGHINMIPDSDGTLRWEPLVIGHNANLYPSLTLWAAATYLGVPKEKIVLDAAAGIRLGKRYIPTDRWGRMLINYYGPEHTFRHLSISDILDGNVKPGMLEGRIVLIGATAVGIYDLRVTPFSPAMPGIEKHASVIMSILDNRLLTGASRSANIAIVIFSGFIFSLLVTRFRALWASVITALALLSIFSAGYYVFAYKQIWVNMAYPSANILLIFISVTAYHFAVEEKYARRIRAMFSNYVTERLVNEMIKNPDMAKLGGERRCVTVLFSDVSGFTAFSEKHAPEEVVAILNEYLHAMTEVIFKWEGILDKFIGDAIVAFWGAPMRQENHSELAVRCALNMVKRLGELQEKWKSEGKDPLSMGIGINTGEVIVGNIGAEGMKMDYTVIGDHVNLGARIESLTRKYNVYLLMSEYVVNNIRGLVASKKIGHVSVKGLENVIVKGKETPVGIYEIKALHDDAESIISEPENGKVLKLTDK